MFRLLDTDPAARPREYADRVVDAFAEYSQRVINAAIVQVGILCGVETLDDVLPVRVTPDNTETLASESHRTPAALYLEYREAFCAGYALAALVREVFQLKATGQAASDKLVRLVGVIRSQTQVCEQFISAEG